MGIYKDVMGTLVRVLAADNIDNSTKQSWQKLIDAELRSGGQGAGISVRDKFDYDCCLYALLHRELVPAQWVARFYSPGFPSARPCVMSSQSECRKSGC